MLEKASRARSKGKVQSGLLIESLLFIYFSISSQIHYNFFFPVSAVSVLSKLVWTVPAISLSRFVIRLVLKRNTAPFCQALHGRMTECSVCHKERVSACLFIWCDTLVVDLNLEKKKPYNIMNVQHDQMFVDTSSYSISSSTVCTFWCCLWLWGFPGPWLDRLFCGDYICIWVVERLDTSGHIVGGTGHHPSQRFTVLLCLAV